VIGRDALDYRRLATGEKRSTAKKNRVGISRRDFVLELLDKSGFGLLRVRCFPALRFQLRELLCRKNSFRLFQECLPAFLGAACFHAFSLPGFDLCLLISCEIKRCQINARHRIRMRGSLGTTRLVSCKRTGRHQHRNGN
jgi:hypothetical protein